MEHSTSSPSSLDKGKREPEMEKSKSGGSSSLDKGKREPEMEDSQSGPSSPLKGKTMQEIEDEGELGEQDEAVGAIMAKTKYRTEEDQRIKDLADKLNKKLTGQPGASVERPCIYVVHEKFSRTNNYAYTPETVSIGPFHRDKKILQVMEDLKERYMNTLLSRAENKLITLERCVKSIRKLIESARKCYSEQIHCDDTTFTIMMIVDGLFIIELLLRNSSLVTVAPAPDDPIFNNHLLLLSIVRDLTLLENQIPMVVLEELFTIITIPMAVHETLEQLAIGLFVKLIPTIPTIEQGRERLPYCSELKDAQSKHLLDLVRNSLQLSFGDRVITETETPRNSFTRLAIGLFVNWIKHLLDLVRNSLDPTQSLCNNSLQFIQVPCVTELRKAGIKLKQRTDAESIFDIKFRNGVLEIPPLLIGHQTETLFRNVIACEQYCDGNHSQMISYAFLMDGLIESPNDVEILRGKGIIQHSLGADEYVSSLFNDLCYEVCLTEYKYAPLCRDLNVYYNKQWKKWFHDLVEYFRAPSWKAISIIVGALVLILTAGSFVCAVLALILPGPK